MEVATFTTKGRKFTLKSDDPVLHECHKSGRFYEQGMLDWIAANIPGGGLWLDVGANIGNHSIYFAAFCNAQVVAFEPVTENVLILKENARLNDLDRNITALAVGCGMDATPLKYDTPTGGKRWSQVQLGEHGTHSAPVITIDSLNFNNARLMKFDCEGMEPEALAGAMRTIKRETPELFIEIWSQAVLELLQEQLGALGYKLIECYGDAPVFFFSTRPFPVTYKKRELYP